MPESNDPLPSLDHLQQKIEEIQRKSGRNTSGRQEQTPADSQSGIGMAMRLGVDLVSGVAVGSVIGFLIDRWIGTMPLFFIICFFLGAAAGFTNLYREAQKNSDELDSTK